MDVNRLLTALLRPETSRDKWLRAAITGAGAALALLIAAVLFATAGDDGGSATIWETTTGTVTGVRAHTDEDEDGNVIEATWFVTYEYTTDAYRIMIDQPSTELYAVGDPVTVYYAADNHDMSRLITPDEDDDSGGGTVTGVILLVMAGLLTALAMVQIVDLRRDAMGPDA